MNTDLTSTSMGLENKFIVIKVDGRKGDFATIRDLTSMHCDKLRGMGRNTSTILPLKSTPEKFSAGETLLVEQSERQLLWNLSIGTKGYEDMFALGSCGVRLEATSTAGLPPQQIVQGEASDAQSQGGLVISAGSSTQTTVFDPSKTTCIESLWSGDWIAGITEQYQGTLLDEEWTRLEYKPRTGKYGCEVELGIDLRGTVFQTEAKLMRDVKKGKRTSVTPSTVKGVFWMEVNVYSENE